MRSRWSCPAVASPAPRARPHCQPRGCASALTRSAAALARPGALLLDEFSYTFEPRERVGVVGPNGVGKSSFVKLLAGAPCPRALHADRRLPPPLPPAARLGSDYETTVSAPGPQARWRRLRGRSRRARP
jgi:hypothetical protein